MRLESSRTCCLVGKADKSCWRSPFGLLFESRGLLFESRGGLQQQTYVGEKVDGSRLEAGFRSWLADQEALLRQW